MVHSCMDAHPPIFCIQSGAFDLLAYTSAESKVPEKWEQSDARMIANSQEVKLRSFTTKVSPVGDLRTFNR